jgi:hypothetical protein
VRVPVAFADGVKEVEVEHTVIIDPQTKKPKEIYRSGIFSAYIKKDDKVVFTNVYVEFDPATGEIRVVEVK